MTERSRNVVVGITTFLGIGLLSGLLMLFGQLPTWMEEGYEMRVHLPDASGLAEGSRVKLSGIDVGRVTSVQLEEPHGRGTVISIFILEHIKIPIGVRVRAQQPLLGGSPSIAFEFDGPPPMGEQDFLPTDGSALINGEALTMMSQFAGELQAAMAEPTRVFEEAGENFEKLSRAWVQVGSNINNLVEQRAVESVDTGEAIGNLATVLARADERLNELQKVMQGLDRWVNDPKLREDVVATVANAREATRKFSDGADHVDELIQTTRASVDALSLQYISVADDVSGAVLSLRGALDKAHTEDGAIGKFLNDPALYDNLNNAAVRLEKLLKEGRLLIQKWKAEGLPVQF